MISVDKFPRLRAEYWTPRERLKKILHSRIKTVGHSGGWSDKYIWTQHSRMKMRHYRLTESRIKRVIRHPARAEEGILPRAIAAMSPAEGKKYSEIWVMYMVTAVRGISNSQFPIPKPKRIKVITAWRYPGHAPERDPVPDSILKEIKGLLN
ncbi:MAG: hypothetical protein HYT98_01060 [Candidatus Sungbacteria bacterium]|nr:hypothetical protein [Candidatus Sungbacteria bacterium]